MGIHFEHRVGEIMDCFSELWVQIIWNCLWVEITEITNYEISWNSCAWKVLGIRFFVSKLLEIHVVEVFGIISMVEITWN